MNITTASGVLCLTCSAESWPQSTRSVLEMPVPRCASRTVLTPSDARSRASSASSGWASESPVTSSVPSFASRLGFSPSAAGSKASGVTGAAPPETVAAPALAGGGVEGPRPAGQLLVGRQPRRRAVDGVGERQPVGEPARRCADRAHDGALDAGVQLLARAADRVALQQDEQERGEDRRRGSRRARVRRRPVGRSRMKGSRWVGTSELEVDERWHALAGHRRSHEHDDHRHASRRARPDAGARSVRAGRPSAVAGA